MTRFEFQRNIMSSSGGGLLWCQPLCGHSHSSFFFHFTSLQMKFFAVNVFRFWVPHLLIKRWICTSWSYHWTLASPIHFSQQRRKSKRSKQLDAQHILNRRWFRITGGSRSIRISIIQIPSQLEVLWKSQIDLSSVFLSILSKICLIQRIFSQYDFSELSGRQYGGDPHNSTHITWTNCCFESSREDCIQVVTLQTTGCYALQDFSNYNWLFWSQKLLNLRKQKSLCIAEERLSDVSCIPGEHQTLRI